MDIELTTSDIV